LKTESCLDAFVEASAHVLRTSNELKIKALENFVCNVAIEPDVDDAVDSICLRLLTVLSGSHLFVLERRHELQTDLPNEIIPEYEQDREKWDLVMIDLAQLGLTGPYGPDGLSPTGQTLMKRLAPV